MDHIASVRAALKAAAPVVAIPIEGRAPICIKARLLKGALKGVTIDSVQVLENNWLKVTGRAIGKPNGYSSIPVRTSCKFAPMDRCQALRLISDWSEKERKKRIKIINQGVLSAEAQRAMKLAQAEKAGISELIQAQKDEQEIFADARSRINPVIDPYDHEDREPILEEYRAYRAQQRLRKRGSTILWRIKMLKAELAKITILKGGKGRSGGRKKTFARKQTDIPKMLLLMREIASLEKTFESLCPSTFREFYGCTQKDTGEPAGYWVCSWIEKRPKKLPYSTPWHSWNGEDDRETLQRMAERLKEARANIRALSPPADEQEETAQEQIAA